MALKDYVFARVEGKCVYITDIDGNKAFIALCLLPEGADMGRNLHFEMFASECRFFVL